MMKARAGDTVIFGLSDINLERLREGKPIMFNDWPGLPGVRVVILHGPTETDCVRQLCDLGMKMPKGTLPSGH
jgi:hypothetical protein